MFVSSLVTAQNEADTSKFIQTLHNDIEQKKYIWVTNTKEIPKFVYKFILHWKSKNEKRREKPAFKLANPNEGFNASCYVDTKLPNRQLILAGYNNKDWIIVYIHGQGRVHNTKILHFNTAKKNDISFFYMFGQIHSTQTIEEKEKEILRWIDIQHLCLFRGNSDFCEAAADF